MQVRPSVNRVEMEAFDLTTALTAGEPAVIGTTTKLADDATEMLGDGSPAFIWA
jgi:hypothetical protein